MKKFKKLFLLTTLVMLTVSMAACGKKKDKNGESAPAMTNEEMKNYVFREEKIEFLDIDQLRDAFIRGDKIYVTHIEWGEGDYEGVELYEHDTEDSMAREVGVDEAGDVIDDLEFEDDLSETSEEIVNEEAMTDSDANEDASLEGDGANAKKIAVDAFEPDISDAAIEVPEDVTESGDEPMNTLYLQCYDFDGNKLFECEKEFSNNSTLFNYTADSLGNVYFIREEYGYDDITGAYHDDYYIVCVGPEGNEKWEKELGSANQDNDFYVRGLYCIGDDIIALANNASMHIDANGNVSKQAGDNLNDSDVGEIIVSSSGRAIAYVYKEDGAEYHEYDIKSGKIGEKFDVPNVFRMANVYTGTNSDFVLSCDDGIYLYNFGDTSAKKVMDYMASDLSSTGLRDVFFIDDNTFIATYFDTFNDANCISRFIKVDPSEVKDKQIINVAGIWIDWNIKNKIIEYNKNSDDTKVFVVDYSSAAEDYSAVINKLNNDIVSGNIPDVVIMTNELNFDNYAGKGLFEDLNPYFEKDSEIKKEDYMSNIFDICSVKDKLYGICPSFYLSTAYAKKSIVGDKTSWTMDEFKELSKKYGNGKSDFGLLSKSEFINLAFSYNSEQFVDWTTGKVNIDSPEFVSLLQYTDNLPLDVDYESEEVNEFWNEYETLYREDRGIIYTTTLFSLRDYAYIEQGTFGEPIVAIGFPSENGVGSTINTNSMFCMSAKSKNKDIAWNFIRSFMLDDYQENIGNGFPIKKSAQEVCKKKAMERPYYMDGGKKEYYDEIYYVNGQEVVIKPPTEQKMDELLNFMGTLTSKSNYSEGILNIVNEEAQAYYVGQKSAEDVVKLIQNRVQIYVDENR